MRKVIVLVLLGLVLSSVSFASISVKGAYDGGAIGVIGVIDREIKSNITLAGELGYCLGNQYSVILAGITGKMMVKNNIYTGLRVDYASYSDPVSLPIGGNITEKTGIGATLLVGMNVKDNVYTQLGYGTRVGGVVEVGYIVKN